EIPIVGMDTDFTIYAKASKAGMVDSGIVSRRFRMGYVFTSAPVFQLAYQQNIINTGDGSASGIQNKTKALSNGGTFDLTGMMFCTGESHASVGYNPRLTITSATSGAQILVEIYEYNLGNNTANDSLFSHKALTNYSSPLQLYDKNGANALWINGTKDGHGTKYVIKATARKDGCRDSTSTTTFQVYGVAAQ
ncbi:MAG: hypothetical protein GY754_12810, partial [bacterium]|nr:hypothetical protein [bacterium]